MGGTCKASPTSNRKRGRQKLGTAAPVGQNAPHDLPNCLLIHRHDQNGARCFVNHLVRDISVPKSVKDAVAPDQVPCSAHLDDLKPNRGKAQVRVTVGPVAALSRTPSGRETDTKARLALQAASQVPARGRSTPKIATLFPARRRKWQGARSRRAPTGPSRRSRLG